MSRATTIAGYIAAAPAEGQAHLRKLHAILKHAAPKARETIKWGTPFFVEPRFVFAFSAHKAHLDFAPPRAVMQAFREELAAHRTTQNFLQVGYADALPEDLIRRMAECSVRTVSERTSKGFW